MKPIHFVVLAVVAYFLLADKGSSTKTAKQNGGAQNSAPSDLVNGIVNLANSVFDSLKSVAQPGQQTMQSGPSVSGSDSTISV